jgi:hypothetical protein
MCLVKTKFLVPCQLYMMPQSSALATFLLKPVVTEVEIFARDAFKEIKACDSLQRVTESITFGQE